MKRKSHIEKFTFNGFQENTYVLHDERHCVIIDPGCYERDEWEELKSFIDAHGLKPLALLLTHAHIDHVLGCHYVLDAYDIDFYLHQSEFAPLKAVSNYSMIYGFSGYIPPSAPTHPLAGGETLTFGEITLNVLYTPGHSPGHVVYYQPQEHYVINGDVLFHGSFGRVDLPGGDLETLKKSIHQTMFQLPDETVIYCGHGPETTIGKEKKINAIFDY